MEIGNDGPRQFKLPTPNPDHRSEPEIEAAQVKERRNEALRVFSGREREVEERICATDRVVASFLNKRRMGYTGGKLTFAEFYCKTSGTTYIYFDKSHREPISSDKNHPAIRPHGRTVLLRVKRTGIPAVMHFWNDEE